jgi:hypothetical protein
LDDKAKKDFVSPVDWGKVGERIDEAIKDQRIKELADEIGLHDKTIYLWTGGKPISVDKLLALSLALPQPVSLHWLLTGKGPKLVVDLEIATGKSVESVLREETEKAADKALKAYKAKLMDAIQSGDVGKQDVSKNRKAG